MTYELKLERLFDAPPDVVFDAFTDPGTQERLHGGGQPDWIVHRCETDVRVGGTSVYAMGRPDEEPDVETRVYSVVDRPHRLELRHTMAVPSWDAPVTTDMTITFEERDGKTLLTMVQRGFEDAATRDEFQESGWPEYLETLRGVAADGLKARHDADESARAGDGGQA